MLQILVASAPVRACTTCAVLLTPNTGTAASRSVAKAQSHQTKVASYCEISFCALKEFQVSMRMGRTRLRAVKLNMNLRRAATGSVLMSGGT